MLRPGVLDRLCADESASAMDGNDGLSWTAYLDAIKRDLQDLLNTRRLLSEEALSLYPEARRSLLLYGLPDLTSLASASATQRDRLISLVEAAIAQFEPRLMGARVIPLAPDEAGREIRFRVEGFVRADPLPARIIFDSAIQVDQQQCRIERVDPDRGNGL